jgi:hypothetical protein
MIEKTAKKTNPTEELPFVEKSNHDNQNKRKIDDHSIQENISNLNEKIRNSDIFLMMIHYYICFFLI